MPNLNLRLRRYMYMHECCTTLISRLFKFYVYVYFIYKYAKHSSSMAQNYLQTHQHVWNLNSRVINIRKVRKRETTVHIINGADTKEFWKVDESSLFFHSTVETFAKNFKNPARSFWVIREFYDVLEVEILFLYNEITQFLKLLVYILFKAYFYENILVIWKYLEQEILFTSLYRCRAINFTASAALIRYISHKRRKWYKRN